MYPTEEGQSLAEYSLQKVLPCFLFKSKLCVSWQNAGQAAVCDRPIYIRDAQIFNVGCIAWRPTSPRHWSREIFPFFGCIFGSRSLMWCRGNSLGPDPPCNGRFHCGAIAAWFYCDGVQYVMRACSEGTSGNALVQNCTELRYSRTIAPFEQWAKLMR